MDARGRDLAAQALARIEKIRALAEYGDPQFRPMNVPTYNKNPSRHPHFGRMPGKPPGK